MAPTPLAPVRVTFISSHALGGGSEHYLELLLGELDPALVGGIVSLQEGPFVEQLRARGRHVEVVPTPAAGAGIAVAVRSLRRVLFRQRPEVVHANGVKAALLAVLATAGTSIPVIWLKHDYSWDGWLARVIAWRCRKVVAVSGAITTTFGPRLRRRVSVVPNGIPDSRLDRAEGRPYAVELAKAAPHAPIAVLVGRLHPAKGQIELIETIPAILARYPDARFILLGGEDPSQLPYAQMLRQHVAQLGLEEAVLFVGHRNDPMKIISGCELLVLPSVTDARGAGREACPFVLLEAMSVGTPVVAYATGGVPEVLDRCGRLVALGDRAELTRAILELFEDKDGRESLAACARARVRARHALSATVESMMECYVEAARG